MVDVVRQGSRVLYRINKDEGDESLSFLVFWRHIVNAIFLKYPKEGRVSSSHVGTRNISSDVCHDVTKHYQVQSEQRRTQNPFKNLRWSVFAQTINTLKLLTEYVKKIHLRCLKGCEYGSAAKQGRCKVCKKNSRCRYLKYKSTWCVFWNISMILASIWLRNVRFQNLWISSV